jgi:hypothetical protein
MRGCHVARPGSGSCAQAILQQLADVCEAVVLIAVGGHAHGCQRGHAAGLEVGQAAQEGQGHEEVAVICQGQGHLWGAGQGHERHQVTPFWRQDSRLWQLGAIRHDGLQGAFDPFILCIVYC